MDEIILDIETVGLPLDEGQRDYFAKSEIGEDSSALWPITGKVCCIGMYNPRTDNFRQYCGHDEAAMIVAFWQDVSKYRRIVTFNGRGFDVPFLLLRSAINNIRPSRKDLMGQRFNSVPHCDLLDQLAFYGATRKFSLDMFCRAFGIRSPKETMAGADVGNAYHAGDLDAIKNYNQLDLLATAALFGRWKLIA